MYQKIPKDLIREITSDRVVTMTDRDRDEMAIPTYLHHNPLINWLMWSRYEAIYKMSSFHKEMVVLEFGCGVGLFLPTLTSSCGPIHAVDLFPDFAKTLCQKYQLAVVFHDKIEEVADSSLDVIIAADVLEHINNVKDYLELFRAKLKVAGTLIVSGPTENFMYRIGRMIAGFRGKGDYHHTNIDDLLLDIGSCGFILQQIQKRPFCIGPALFKIARFRAG